MQRLPVIIGLTLVLAGSAAVAVPAVAAPFTCTVDLRPDATAVGGQEFAVTFTPENDCTSFVTNGGSSYVSGSILSPTGAEVATWQWNTTTTPSTLYYGALEQGGVYTFVQTASGEPTVSAKVEGSVLVHGRTSTGTLTMTSHKGTDAELSGVVATNDGAGNITHPTVLMDLQRKASTGAWQYLISGTTNGSGVVKFAGVNSAHSQVYRMVPQNAYDSLGAYTENTLSVKRSRPAKASLTISASRSGHTVHVYGGFSYPAVWITAAPYKGESWIDSPKGAHVRLQEYYRHAWHTIKTVLTTGPLNQDDRNLSTSVKVKAKTTFRWVYPGSSTFARTTSKSATK